MTVFDMENCEGLADLADDALRDLHTALRKVPKDGTGGFK